MAQSSSAQREPSMEEILASIRRIIEDSDAEKTAPGESDMPVTVAANDESEPGKGIAAFRSELHEEPVQEEPEYEAHSDRFQAYSERTAEPEFGKPDAAAEQVLAMNDPFKPVEPDFAVDTAETAKEILSETPEPQTDFLDLNTALEQHFDTLDAADDDDAREQSVLSEQFDEVATVMDTPPEPAALLQPEPQPRSPILSERSGRQVAAAFGELSEAFAASRRRSFDEMAEEMMRPMLQDWLDNNLPHLVEKLVREEIERIARG